MTLGFFTGIPILQIALSAGSISEKIAVARLLRTICKTFKTTVDDKQGFGLSLLHSCPQINMISAIAQTLLRDHHWFKVHEWWKHDHQVIVLFDYSNSMNGKIADGQAPHLTHAVNILRQLHAHQQDRLRHQLIVYVFGNTFSRYSIYNRGELEGLVTNIETDQIPVDRNTARLRNLFGHLIQAMNSSDLSLELDLISDHEIEVLDVKASVHAFEEAPDTTENIRLNFMPTRQVPAVGPLIEGAQEAWGDLKRKKMIEMELTDPNNGKRQKLEPLDVEEELPIVNSPASPPLYDY